MELYNTGCYVHVSNIINQFYSRIFISRKIMCVYFFDVKWVFLPQCFLFADVGKHSINEGFIS